MCGAVVSTLYGCPLNVPASSCTCSVSGFAAVCSGPVTSGTPTTPTCPPGATLGTVGDGTYSCVETGLEPSCPSPYAIFLDTCVLPDCPGGGSRNPDGNCVPAKSPSPSTSSTPLPPSPLPPAPAVPGCYPGYTLSNGTCIRTTTVCAQGEVLGPNGRCQCPIGASMGPTGVCQCPGGDLANGQRCPRRKNPARRDKRHPHTNAARPAWCRVLLAPPAYRRRPVVRPDKCRALLIPA